MISGIALAAKQINPATRIIAVEPRGKDLGPCLKAKQRLWSNPPQFIDTIAEGIKTQQVIHFFTFKPKTSLKMLTIGQIRQKCKETYN